MTGTARPLISTTALLALLCAHPTLAAPEIRYLKPERAVWVRGFRHDSPATMTDVLAADRTNGWNVVSLDPTTDTFTLKASLWIGGTSSWNPTYLQVGRKGHERETVVVHGNVWVRPPRANLERADGRFGLINRLTLGNPADTNIQACLKIACETREQYGLLVGHRDTEHGTVYGGELYVFNSTITAATQDTAHQLRGANQWQGLHTGWYASRIELVNATVSWIGNCVAYGMQEGDYRIEGSTFDHCATVLMQGRQRVSDCRFLNLTSPAINATSMEFVRCTFKDNEQNWYIQSSTGRSAEMINCDVGTPRKPVQIRKNTKDPTFLVRFGSPVYPFYIERRSCVVEVLDKDGKPIPGAVVSVRCVNDPGHGRDDLSAVRNPVAVTDADGRTPARVEDGAILPAMKILQATDDPGKPKRHDLEYVLTVEATGYKPVQLKLSSDDAGTPQRVKLTPSR